MKPNLTPSDFGKFFQELHGYAPFQWQERLAGKVCGGDWPSFIKLPTSSGKTACLDIAIFALACQAAEHHDAPERIVAPRRIFYVVDRRVIVNEAYQRAQAICDKLEKAIADQSSPLYPVAHWLKSLTRNEHAPPLDCFELRGGIYRDDAWVRSMLQPTILTSTVDQFGSRILFRGYGVSDRNLSIHAALTANDSLVLLDEAHCSQPFSQTVDAIKRFRDAGLAADDEAKWSEKPIRTPFVFTQMTATPDASADAETIFELKPTDYKVDTKLEQRHACQKPIRLVESKAKGKRQNEQLAKSLAEEAKALATSNHDQAPCRRIAIVVNRVACARHTFKLLHDQYGDRVHLMIGRMRPCDRDELTETLQATFRSNPDREQEEQLEEPQFVVATQCLEVGADFDFDGLVSQCASLSALRQRYGRLNRLGLSDHARGAIVMPAGDIKPKDDDPIYGKALPETWGWLQELAEDTDEGTVVDFGIQAMDSVLSTQNTDSLNQESQNAPVLLPAHLDLLCQTSPRPAVDPDIANFLHGPDRGQREVRVCWRADLPDQEGKLTAPLMWADAAHETIAVCPPTSAEVLAVPLHLFRQWLSGADLEDNSGDVLGEKHTEDRPNQDRPTNKARSRLGVVWKGKSKRTSLASSTTAADILPNGTIVLPVSAGGWEHFGHLPSAPKPPAGNEQLDHDRRRELVSIDVAGKAFEKARNRKIVRLHNALVKNSADARFLKPLQKWINNAELRFTIRDVLDAQHDDPDEPLHSDSASDTEASESEMSACCTALQKVPMNRVQLVHYPGGIALIGPRNEDEDAHRRKLPRASFGDDFDEANVDADERVFLADHLADVAQETAQMLSVIPPGHDVTVAVVEAARLHDIGKADPRFQALLLQSTPSFSVMQPRLLAKSALGTSTKHAAGRLVSHSLPSGFRHEMLSVELAQRVANDFSNGQQDLMLHTIAAHHGYARPFAPVVMDNQPPEVSLKRLDGVSDVTLTADERHSLVPSHRLDSGIGERFWRLNKRFGWWGLAWLETTVRLSDWIASAKPLRHDVTHHLASKPVPAMPPATTEIQCIGIDAANPLGFLAALGLLRIANELFPGCRMAWRQQGGWIPVVFLSELVSESDFVASVFEHLTGRAAEPHFTDLGQNTTVPQSEFRSQLLLARAAAERTARTTVDYYAAFGTDGLVSENDETTIQDTALRTMAGAGHQHFLETMRNVIEACTEDQLRKTLLETWCYDDPTQTLSLRFDPLDDNRYALRWRNPSGDPDRKKSGSMLGANRLAIEGIPFFTTAAGPRFLKTVGFQGHRSRDTFLRWPVWTTPISKQVIGALLSSQAIQEADMERLNAIGVSTVFTSQRITVGKVRNFTPAHAVETNARD